MSAKLTFPLADVLELCRHALAAPKHQVPYGMTKIYGEAGPALHLVGDVGIYLLSNGIPGLRREGPLDLPKIVYADEANALTMTAEDCYEAKVRLFGGDDGIESLPWAQTIVERYGALPPAAERAARLQFEIGPSISLIGTIPGS